MVLGKRYASSLIRREELLSGDKGVGQHGKGDEDGAEDDPFAPVDEESDEDPFVKRGSSASGSEVTQLDEAYHRKGKKMKMVSGSIPEDEDEDIDSDEAFGEDDAGKFQGFKFSGSRKKRKTPDATSEDGHHVGASVEDGSEASSCVSEDGSDEGFDMDAEYSEASSNPSDMSPPIKKAAKQSAVHGDRAALKALLSSDTAAVASSLSAAASADAKKGRAVKAQYQTFDRLLDARMKLQKGLTAANSISPQHNFLEQKDTIRAAEEAALTLWNTITSIRLSFAEEQIQTINSSVEKKRKRPSTASTSTSISTLWSTTQSLASSTLPHHRIILNKWSAKVCATNPVARESSSRLLSGSASQNSITTVIDGYLATETDKVVAQSTNTTSTASNRPATHKPTFNPNPTSNPTLVYEDTPFYQSLLRDLITSRSTTTPISNIQDTLPSTTRLHPSGSSHKKTIDTKASKGRKIRYTINEKLQNFMAADAGEGLGWSEAARNEFFASLMGGRGSLNEGAPYTGNGDGDLDDEGEGEVEALRLFRN